MSSNVLKDESLKSNSTNIVMFTEVTFHLSKSSLNHKLHLPRVSAALTTTPVIIRASILNRENFTQKKNVKWEKSQEEQQRREPLRQELHSIDSSLTSKKTKQI